MSEKTITKAVRKKLKEQGIFHWKQVQGPMSTKGVSDIIGIKTMKVAELVAQGVEEVGVFLAIEVKVPGEEATELQQKFLCDVWGNGGIALIADKKEDVEF